MSRIFLNYRRSDADAWADRLFERLTAKLPRDDIFMDIDGDIPVGQPWATWLDRKVAACDLVLVLIGRTWLQEINARSAVNDLDYARIEIEIALTRNIIVVPVLLGDAQLPRAADLPPSLQALVGLQAARLQRSTFNADSEALIASMVRSIGAAKFSPDEPSLDEPAPLVGPVRFPPLPPKPDPKSIIPPPWPNFAADALATVSRVDINFSFPGSTVLRDRLAGSGLPFFERGGFFGPYTPPHWSVGIGIDVDVRIARWVVAAARDGYRGPLYLYSMQDDGAFGRRSRIYVGTPDMTRLGASPFQKFELLLDARLTQEQFHAVVGHAV